MIRRIAMLSVLTLALAACSDDKKPSGGDAVSWAEKVCTTVDAQIAVLTKAPQVDPSDPAKAKEGLLTYLSNFTTALDSIVRGVKDAGTPPVADGAQVVDRVTKALGDARKGVEDARANLEKATITDLASFQEAYSKVGEDMSRVSDLEDPTKDLKANKELNEAFDKAPTCKKLDGGPSTPPSS